MAMASAIDATSSSQSSGAASSCRDPATAPRASASFTSARSVPRRAAMVAVTVRGATARNGS